MTPGTDRTLRLPAGESNNSLCGDGCYRFRVAEYAYYADYAGSSYGASLNAVALDVSFAAECVPLRTNIAQAAVMLPVVAPAGPGPSAYNEFQPIPRNGAGRRRTRSRGRATARVGPVSRIRMAVPARAGAHRRIRAAGRLPGLRGTGPMR